MSHLDKGPLPRTLPAPHRQFLQSLLPRLQADPRIVGLAAGGSFLTDTMDAFSDLDLVVAIEPANLQAVMAERSALATSFGPLLAAFTGEHVGEPRLLICLYAGPPLLHVDLKFVSLGDVGDGVERPAVLWQRDHRVSEALSRCGTPAYPAPDAAWIEARFWVWVHYAATKIGRGELFEAVDFLSFLRMTVLGPLALQRAGARPSGVRRLEQLAPDFTEPLRRTVALYDAADCLRALQACIALYRNIRGEALSDQPPPGNAAELAAVTFVVALEQQLGDAAR